MATPVVNLPGRVLLASANNGLRRHVVRALASMGMEIQHTLSVRSEIEPLLSTSPGMVIADAEGDQETLLWLLKELRTNHPETIVLVISNDLSNRAVFDIVGDERLNNLIAKQGAIAASRTLIDEHELIATCYKLISRDIFGFEKYLSTVGIAVNEIEIKGSKEKEGALERIADFLRRIECHESMIPGILTAADELVMNAVFNAPRDGEGTPQFAALNRTTNVTLPPGQEVGLRYACDGRYVAISVSDRFGSLSREVLVKYLDRGLLGRTASIEQKPGGAGVGLHMVLSSITQLVFNIQPGRMTEVIALFYVRGGGKVLKTSGRSLNIFLVR